MSETPEPAEPRPEESSPAVIDLRWLVAHSFTTGLCPLIPIPFLDDWTRDLLRRRHTKSLASAHGLSLEPEAIRLLALGDDSFQFSGCFKGCLHGAALKTVLYIIKKLFLKAFRTVVIFLTFRSCAKELTRSFQESYLLDHALRLGALPREGTAGRAQVHSVRRAIENVRAETDPGPLSSIVRGTLEGSRGLLRQSARSLSRTLRSLRRRKADEAEISSALDREGEEELGGLIDRLTADLRGEGAYLETLERRLEERLGLGTAPTT
jgi:hypothetical protein